MKVHIGWPQGLMLLYLALGYIPIGFNNGKMVAVTGSYSFGVFLRWTIILTLLVWGGFFG